MKSYLTHGPNIGVHYISPTYVEYTKKRLETWEREKSQVEKEKAKHVVKDPFKARKERGTVTWPFAPDNDSSE